RPLRERKSLTRVDAILRDPAATPPPLAEPAASLVREAAERIRAARDKQSTVMLLYGAHLVRNGAALILERLMADGWLTHLATNGAGAIHDWEYAWLGASTEDVTDNVADGTFGAWDETGRLIHIALLVGGIIGEGFGRALGRFILEDGALLPEPDALRRAIQDNPEDSLTPARAELLHAMRLHGLSPG